LACLTAYSVVGASLGHANVYTFSKVGAPFGMRYSVMSDE